MENNLLRRAHILIQQDRYSEAEQVLKQVMVTESDNPNVLVMYCQVLLQLEKYQEAEKVINTAISLMPDADYLFFTKARIMLNVKRLDEAEKCLQQAITLDANEADYYALWAFVKIGRKQFEKGLDLANQALTIDGENLMALNARSSALVKLGRKEESFTTIKGALEHDPNNAYTHANYGWNLLEKGQHQKAQKHFREALKIDPNLDYAKQGMLESIKATNIIYRQYLKYQFWMAKLSGQSQWLVILGAYFGYRILSSYASKNPSMQPYLNPVLYGIAFLFFLTWVMTPLGNLILRLNPYGKHLLDDKQLKSANVVGVCAGIFAVGSIALLLSRYEPWLAVMFVGLSMMIPASTMFMESRYKNLPFILAVALGVIGIGAATLAFSTGVLLNPLSLLYGIGIFAFQWIVNFIAIKEDNV